MREEVEDAALFRSAERRLSEDRELVLVVEPDTEAVSEMNSFTAGVGVLVQVSVSSAAASMDNLTA
jgi:hypothetical protein